MSITNELDADALISRLAGPLSPPDRIAFRRAAEDALTRVPCWGEGAVYRAVAGLQKAFFDPPSDGRACWGIERELVHRQSKLKAAPAIEYPGDGRDIVIARMHDEGAPCTGAAPKSNRGGNAWRRIRSA